MSMPNGIYKCDRCGMTFKKELKELMTDEPKYASAKSDGPDRVLVKIGWTEYVMSPKQATDLHRDLFNAVLQAVTDKCGKWTWENPGKDDPI